MSLDQFFPKKTIKTDKEESQESQLSEEHLDRQILNLLQEEPREHYIHFVVSRLQARFGVDINTIQQRIGELVRQGKVVRTSETIQLSR